MRLPAAFMIFSAFVIAAHAEEISSEQKISVTISPFHLLCPELHLTGERRLSEKASAAVMLGAGQVTDEGKRYAIGEVGGQVRYYLLGSFTHGMMLGVDVGYVDVDGEMENPMEYLVGWRAGGVVGYKIAMKAGLTLEAQIGPVYVWGKGGSSELQTYEGFRVGWSF